MRCPIFMVLFFLTSIIRAQPNTEVYLLDIGEENGKISLSNLRNISNNEGYDNQPSFYDDDTIIFSSTRNGQTDIAKFEISSGTISWISDTPEGSEYSPLSVQGSKDISSIRLDNNGLQRLYRYDISTGKSEELLKDLKVGYHVWYNDHILVSTVLVENRMDLVVSNLKDKTNNTVRKNVGRSLHKIPSSDLISFIDKEKIAWQIKSLHPLTGAIETISNIPNTVNDICWLADSNILVPSGKSILNLQPGANGNPNTLHLFEEAQINNISRMAVSADGNHLAIVSEESPAKIVQKQVDSYNAGDLDAFVNCYAEDVVVSNFPADTLYVGHEKMRKNYGSLSPDNKVYDVEVVKRIVIGNKVIDHEKVDKNGTFQQMQIALYEVNNGKISSMTFIFDEPASENPETIVQQQMEAYNARDIYAFLDTYTDEIEVYNFPNEARYTGKLKMRESYTTFFDSSPDLNYVVKNRMVIRNIVIDEEYITANGKNFSAVAVYEVENGKIAKVTFLR